MTLNITIIAAFLWLSIKSPGFKLFFFFFFRGPEGVKIENSNSSIATVTGLQDGKYEFTLTVQDDRGLKDQATVSVIVKEGEWPQNDCSI